MLLSRCLLIPGSSRSFGRPGRAHDPTEPGVTGSFLGGPARYRSIRAGGTLPHDGNLQLLRLSEPPRNVDDHDRVPSEADPIRVAYVAAALVADRFFVEERAVRRA